MVENRYAQRTRYQGVRNVVGGNSYRAARPPGSGLCVSEGSLSGFTTNVITMENLITILLTLSILGLVIGLIYPKLFSWLLKERATRKGVLVFLGGATILFFVAFAVIVEPVDTETAVDQEVVAQAQVDQVVSEPEEETSPKIISFETLREWDPDQEPEAIGLEILINKDQATEENIVALVRDIAGDKQKAFIKVYQDKQAWDEEKTGDYTEASKSGYLAIYVKNITNNGAYRGFNEIRWFQMQGQLEHLDGTVTKMN